MIKVLRNWMDRYLSDEEAILFALLLIGFFVLIIWLGQPLAPVFTAVILAFIMQGGVERLVGLGLGKFWSVMVVFLSTILAFVGFLVGVVPALFQQAENFLSELPNLILTVQVQLENLAQRYPHYFNPEQISQLINQAGQQISGLGQWVLSFSLESLPGLIGLLIYLVLVPILVFFFLKDADLILGSIGKVLPDRRPIMAQVWVEMKAQVSNYVRGKFLEIVIVGIVSYLAFAFMDLRYAGLLALLVGLSVVVPYIGAAVVTIPVAAVAFVQWGWSSEFYWLLGVYALIQALDGNVLVPLLFSEVVNLHPVAIIVAVLLFGGIWGFWGVFFAIPLATLFKAVVSAWPVASRQLENAES
ncbi:MAG: AI-2E family transporter [Pseudomonadales bacterium]